MHPPPALPLPPGPSLEESLQSCPRLKADDVQRLQEWLNKQPHLPRMSEESIARLHEHKDWMLSLAARGADESKRPADSSQRSAFGIVGSFKKLEID
ncbi:Protein of unknown function [Gryllus bimaculatus]|nr:Protein of unknown function [Gryllus bimaculatus]